MKLLEYNRTSTQRKAKSKSSFNFVTLGKKKQRLFSNYFIQSTLTFKKDKRTVIEIYDCKKV